MPTPSLPRSLFSIVVFLAALSLAQIETLRAETIIDVDRIMSAAATKLASHDSQNTDKTLYPNEADTSSATSSWQTIGPQNWVSGFYPGTLWLLHEHTGDDIWRTRADAWMAGIESQKTNTGTHDLGFMINNSFGNAFRLTGNEAYKDVVLTAADSLSQRYNPAIGTIRSWGSIADTNTFQVIIDTMMNLEMLYWAADNGGAAHDGTTQELIALAISHADHTIANHVRADGSTFHVVNYDQNGSVESRYTAQGKSNDSTWSRGQAWGVYGFTATYRETNELRFLDTARNLADYFIDNVEDDGWIPAADFDSEFTGLAFKDATASAIAASGLIELSDLEPDPDRKQKYWNAAVSMLDALTREDSPYFSDDLNDSPGLLLHGSRRYPGDDKTYVWGDYYLVEATMRYSAVAAIPEPTSWQLATVALLAILSLRKPTSPTFSRCR